MASRPRRSSHTPAAKGSKWIAASTRWAIYHRDDFACVYCCAVGPLSLDHVRSVEGHGARDNRPENLVSACLRCNSRKQARSKRAWLAMLRADGIDTDTVLRRIARLIAKPIDRARGRFLASSRTDTYADEVTEALEPTPPAPVALHVALEPVATHADPGRFEGLRWVDPTLW